MRCNMGHILEYAFIYISYERVQGMVENTAYMFLRICFIYIMSGLVAQMAKNLSAVWETWVRSLSWDDLPEKEQATHSSILAWRIPWTAEPGKLQATVHGAAESNMTEQLNTLTACHLIYPETDQLICFPLFTDETCVVEQQKTLCKDLLVRSERAQI